MKRKTSGFTIVEIVFVLMVTGILTGMAFSTFSGLQTRFAVRGAKVMYATLHQRARSRAVELGETVIFFVDTVGDSAYIVSNGVTTDVTRFAEQMDVDLRASQSTYFLCMTPRGYADYECGSYTGSFTATTNSMIRLEFWRGADSTSVIVLPMGQLVGM